MFKYKAGCKCFVPSCTNSNTQSNKHFVYVNASNCQTWCRLLQINYNPLKKYYCCEDHLDFKEDLVNYESWRRGNCAPKLKPAVVLKNYVNLNKTLEERMELTEIVPPIPSQTSEEKLPSCSYAYPSTSTATAVTKIVPPIPSKSALREMLINSEENLPSCSYSYSSKSTAAAVTKIVPPVPSQTIINSEENLPSCSYAYPSTSTAVQKVHRASQCKVNTADKSTMVKRKICNCNTVYIPSRSILDQLASSSDPSGNPTSSDYIPSDATTDNEAIEDNNLIKTWDKQKLDIIKEDPKMFLGLPKEYIWVIDHIVKESRNKVNSLDIIIALLKLKQNDSMIRISKEFQLSENTISKMFLRGVTEAANFFQNLVYMPAPEKIKQNLPPVFKIRYSNVTSIIDAFEIQVQKPTDPLRQAQTWSAYKACNTVKYLIACAPNGFVTFISKGFGGRISDKALLEECGLLDLLPSNGILMADRGFKDAESFLIAKGIKLLRPPSVSANVKPSREEVKLSKVIASLRVHVERVIRRIREFNFLKMHSTVTHKHVGLLDHMVIIACGLCNLQEKIIK